MQANSTIRRVCVARSAVVLFLGVFFLVSSPVAQTQTTVTINWRDTNFPTQFNSGGDFFDNGTAELGMWANSGAKQTAAWKNFTVDGNNGSAARNLQIGDVFTITVAATRAFGQIGFSLNAGGTQGTSYANNISGSRMFVNTDNFGSWYVGGLSGGATANLGYTPIQDVYKDYRFTVRITSQTTADIILNVDGTDYRAYNRTLGGSAGANISAFSIYGSDMWDGTSNDNAYWKQTTTVQNSGRVELGYFAAAASTVTPGLITDGLAANSTSTSSANSVFIGGDAGSQVNLNQANTYTGTTTVNANARLEVQHANALGGTANGTVVSDGGALSLYQGTGGITVAGESLTLNGVGVSGANGALRSTGGNNAWNGTISLGTNSRINADTTGISGSLTLGGSVAGGTNVLFLGAMGGTNGNTGGNITINGAISGAGATQDGTTTSIFKDGSGSLTLGAANTYTGDTRINQGNLTVSGSGNLGSGSDVFIASGASLSVNASSTVASVQEWGTTNGGTISLGSGATLTVNGADKGIMYQNSISGSGNLTMAGSGNSSLSLYGTPSYTGTTTVSGGKISSGVALASTNIAITGGTFETSSSNIVADTSTVDMSSGTYSLGGNDTVKTLNITGGLLTTTNGATLSTTDTTLYSTKINGGTITANVNSAGGVAFQSGSTTINGKVTAAGSSYFAVNGGAVTTTGTDNIGDSSFVNLISGSLTLGGNETVGNFQSSGGSLLGSGNKLQAGTYGLNGGTISANLGTGNISTSSGSTTLNGTSDSANVTLWGGSLLLGANERLNNSASVSVSGGLLNLQTFNETVSTLSVTNAGTVSGSGTLTAANYNLNGGAVNANLGSGTITASTNTTTLNGTAGATTVTVNGGTLNTGGANKLADTATVAVSSGTLGVGGNDTVGSVAISSTGTVTVANGSTLTATANSSISGTGKATGGTLAVANNANLNLANDAKTTTSDISVGSGSALTGTGGTTGKISGGGLLSAGNSPGILTAGQVDVSGGLDFAFEFTGSGAPTYTSAGNSRNDLLHLTNGSNPFVGSFSSANNLAFYFNDSSLNANLLTINPTTYLGGFYVDSLSFDIAALLSAATKSYYIADANGLISFNGVSYSLMSSDVASRVALGNTNQSNSNFDTGTTSGTVLSVTMVPEPSSASLLTFALSGLLALRRRKA